MPTPLCASFSPAAKSPKYCPPLGHLMVDIASASSRLACASAGGLSDEHAACAASCFSRSALAMPWSRNEAFIIAANCASRSAGLGPEAQPASSTAAAAATILGLACIFVSSTAQRLIAGTIDSAPRALTPMYEPSAIVTSEPNPG